MQPDHHAGNEEGGHEGGDRRKRRGRCATPRRAASAQAACAASATGDAHHLEPDLVARPFDAVGRAGLELAGVDDRDAVGDLEKLVEILADDEDRAALAGEIDQRLPDESRGAGIDAPGRLVDDEERRARGSSRGRRRISAGCRPRACGPADRAPARARRSSATIRSRQAPRRPEATMTAARLTSPVA